MAMDEPEINFPDVVKKFMYVNRRAPYGTIYSLESLEVVLIGAAFDQDVSLAFLDDGNMVGQDLAMRFNRDQPARGDDELFVGHTLLRRVVEDDNA